MRAALANAAVVGVDTESNSLHAYREQVCLIQFSTREQDYLVDPLAGLNLTPLGKLFSSSGVVKVFHASEYDIICLRRDFNFEFTNIFDTMQAARILGREKLSLGDVLEREFGIHLDKHLQKANWAIRPPALAFASLCLLGYPFLIPLYLRLEQELRENGWTYWLRKISTASAVPEPELTTNRSIPRSAVIRTSIAASWQS